ncbi:hypothetical protein LPC10_14605 [Methylorubrum sp. B1-46]|jgi:hypothetical protein|uniref:hypothetical protein n=1 Tax=Methylorubrum sp. B1-46 TaxID=2897334 RepID=UPI001E4E0E54|nr:hypothetical protein [Methylorubrum sp. B1-46]UGB24196.1 hypothetical protein LPC10_14605 [Methylorubrum sp. B1-46]
MLATLLGGPLTAADRASFAPVGDWAIERRPGPSDAPACRMTRTERDAQGEIRRLVIVSLDRGGLSLAVADRNWDFPAGERFAVPMLLNGKPAGTTLIWTGDGQILRTPLPETIVPDLLSARALALRFAEGDMAVAIPDLAAAVAALRLCATGAASQPTVAVEPPLPPKARMATYTVGLALQGVLRTCNVAATDAQREAVEARMAALRPEMAPFEAAMRAQVTKSRGFACPTADREAEFQEALRRFITLSPDEFANVIDRQAEAAPGPPVAKP